MSEKECTKCGEVKAFAEYSKCKGGRFGLHAKCKACFSEYMKEWRPRRTKIIYCSIKLQERECTKCGEVKDFAEYHKDKYSSTGCKPSCKQCSIKHRKENAEILKERNIHYLDERLNSILETFIEEEIEEIVGSNDNPLEKYGSLNK